MRLDQLDEEQVALAIVEYVAANIDESALERFAKFASAVADWILPLAASLEEAFKRNYPRLEAILSDVTQSVARAEAYWAAQPPSAGLEPLLVSKGYHPPAARCLAYLFVDLWRGIAAALELEDRVVPEIRRIAKARYIRAACRRAAPAILSSNIHELEGRLFGRHGVRLDDFLEQFRLAIDGNLEAQTCVQEIARVLAPHLRGRPGRKPSPASVARELMEEAGALFGSFARYAYDPIDGDFCDPITLALRKEFGEPAFDPRAALRRAARGPRDAGACTAISRPAYSRARVGS